MTGEITKQELDNVISRLITVKMPGVDGYPAEWYNTFREILTAVLLKCFSFTLKGEETTKSWRQEIISIIPKTGKYKSESSSYRPISIQSSDCRLYTSIITTRTQNLLPDIMDEDQTGFLKNRQTQDDVRWVLHFTGTSEQN